MGQYFKLYNPDKKEVVDPGKIGNFRKLTEQVGFEKSTSTALWLMCANSNGRGGGDAKPHDAVGRWAGDRIVVQGDYAEAGDPGFIEDPENYTDVSASVADMLDKEFQ